MLAKLKFKKILNPLAAAVFACGVMLSPQTMAAKYKEKSVVDGGSITGLVKFEGNMPEIYKTEIAKDNDVCGAGEVIPNPITLGANGELTNTVVYLEKVAAGKSWPEQEYVLDQKKCTFEPYLQVVPKGVKMTIRNSDPVLHNVHPFELVGDKRRTLFNLAQPKQDQVNTKKIKTRRGKAVELACDAHSWMAGWLYVLENPYYAIIDASGKYEIADVPAGDYKLVAWHPVLGTMEKKISVGGNSQTGADFVFNGGA